MLLQSIRFLSLLFTALAMAPALAHAFELPNKITLLGPDYLTVQQIYRGWILLGIFEIGALLLTLILLFLVRQTRKVFFMTLLAVVCLAAVQAVFWLFTFPVNQQTHNWTVLPENWMLLRNQWEYSHATRAVLSVTGLSALLASVLIRQD
jgi:hypothetical protein